MLARNLSTTNAADHVQRVVADVSRELYAGNLICTVRPEGAKGTACRFTLAVASSFAPPARRAASGRRLPKANWDAHREVMSRLFDANPHMVLASALATYRGRQDFLRTHAQTYGHNAGSKMHPAAFGDL